MSAIGSSQEWTKSGFPRTGSFWVKHLMETSLLKLSQSCFGALCESCWKPETTALGLCWFWKDSSMKQGSSPPGFLNLCWLRALQAWRSKGKRCSCLKNSLYNLSAGIKILGEGGWNKFVFLSCTNHHLVQNSSSKNQLGRSVLPVPSVCPEIVQAPGKVMMDTVWPMDGVCSPYLIFPSQAPFLPCTFPCTR